MNNKLFVGNLSFKVTETELQEVFAQSGEVLSVSIPTDKYTGKSAVLALSKWLLLKLPKRLSMLSTVVLWLDAKCP